MKAPNMPFVSATTNPFFQSKASYINSFLNTWSLSDLKKRMKLSDNLAKKSLLDIKEWNNEDNSHPSVLFYTGTAFKTMQPEKWTLDNISFAQKHLLILSGLYGVLKPFDLISSYRLEMGIKYSFLPDYANLYNF